MFAFQTKNREPAIKFLNALTQEQKNKAQMPFDDAAKLDWHYFPASMYPRAGISISELNENQKQILFQLLQASLSETGYVKTQQIISLENVLSELSDNTSMRDPEKYYAAFYGNPEKDSLWAWSFQGHHLSLNFTILNGKMEIAPRFMGANPATVKSGSRKGERTLSVEEDLGLQLINSIQDKQQAIFSERSPYDIVTGNSSEVEPLAPVGIKMGDLSPENKNLLLRLINEYLATMPDELAAKRSQNLENEEMNDIRFGWAGATQSGLPHYYRIQGTTFLIEFDNSQNNANHIHSVWRDFNGDFGRNLIREHYQNSEHQH